MLGDLNETLTDDLDRIQKSGRSNLPSDNTLKEVIASVGLLDGFRDKNGSKREYTMTKVYKDGRVSRSRIDHILYDPILSQTVTQVKIKPHNKLFSDHHHAITAKLTLNQPFRTEMRTSSPLEVTLIKINT